MLPRYALQSRKEKRSECLLVRSHGDPLRARGGGFHDTHRAEDNESDRASRAVIMGTVFCCLCRFFLICKGMQILDGDDPEIIATLYSKICPSFDRIESPEELFGKEKEDGEDA